MSAYTPGPWYAKGVYVRQVETDLGIVSPIGGEGREDDEMFANARLIAAAPDLLKACEAAWVYLDLDSVMLLEGSKLGTLAEKLEAAIARARGA